MCECFQIGGPFIAEDPDCPVHGHEAQQCERIETQWWEAPFSADATLMELIQKIVIAKSLGQTRLVGSLMHEAIQLHMFRAEGDDWDFAETQVRDIILFFAK